jgi:hypothetical protein
MESILKILNVKDVLPPYITISHIRTLEELCKYLIFPFMQLYLPSSQQDSASESEQTENSQKKL